VENWRLLGNGQGNSLSWPASTATPAEVASPVTSVPDARVKNQLQRKIGGRVRTAAGSRDHEKSLAGTGPGSG